MFSLACSLTKNNVEFLPVEISSKKVRANNVGFSTIKITWNKVSENSVSFLTREITSKKVRRNNVGCSTIEIKSKKVRGKNVDISTSKITPKKVHGNDVDFLISEFISKKLYQKSMSKWPENSSKFDLRCINVISTWNRRRLDVVRPLGYDILGFLNSLYFFKLQSCQNRLHYYY